jgi:hypothetical protein
MPLEWMGVEHAHAAGRLGGRNARAGTGQVDAAGGVRGVGADSRPRGGATQAPA